MVSLAGLEPAAHSLEGCCSIQLSYRPIDRNGGHIDRHYLGAGDGNRTHMISLEGWSSTTELHPQIGKRFLTRKLFQKTCLAILQQIEKIVHTLFEKRDIKINMELLTK